METSTSRLHEGTSRGVGIRVPSQRARHDECTSLRHHQLRRDLHHAGRPAVKDPSIIACSGSKERDGPHHGDGVLQCDGG